MAQTQSEAQNVTVKPAGCGFVLPFEEMKCLFKFYFHFIVSGQSAAFCSAIQHAMPPEFGTK